MGRRFFPRGSIRIAATMTLTPSHFPTEQRFGAASRGPCVSARLSGRRLTGGMSRRRAAGVSAVMPRWSDRRSRRIKRGKSNDRRRDQCRLEMVLARARRLIAGGAQEPLGKPYSTEGFFGYRTPWKANRPSGGRGRAFFSHRARMVRRGIFPPAGSRSSCGPALSGVADWSDPTSPDSRPPRL